MNITTYTGLVGFFLALSALHVSEAAAMSYPTAAATDTTHSSQTVESRLTRLTEAIRQREALLPEGTTTPSEMLIAIGFANGGGGGGFANRSGGGGFANGGGGGGFVNINPWRNAWANGGGFLNRY
ncbi:MAG TPA: rSAM-associated Gly-rich repeat protein [Leptolyngbyaceae cyanobacterium M33_DOE_097]|uniref:RSAM-associated Gly-rich repeat protein n=1 Tax=Oscillatoriales cyanobacterium SpSt-418 TaxID=2282169 RepID=A0A7C3KGT5_9CYAN|nr:rSAM-associated Gly-rich repeat protein [Leptolyngbyaceae cyanobacterium M33_DOE_097]